MKNIFLSLIQRQILKKDSPDRLVKYTSLPEVHSFGYLYDASQEGMKEAVRVLRETLISRKIAYRGVCVDLRDESLRDTSTIANPYQVNLYPDNLSWYQSPDMTLVADFIKEPFDILLDLSSKRRLFALDYILHCSAASLKIGTDKSHPAMYDLLFAAGDGLPAPTASELVSQIFNYLSIIQKSTF